MRGKGKDEEQMAIKRKAFVEKAYELFSSKGIEGVSLQDIATASGYGIATLYRYFSNKPTLVVEVATWRWQQYFVENQKRRPNADFSGMTAVQVFEFYLDSILELYRNHKDLLKFNQLFNIYIQSVNIDSQTISPYRNTIKGLGDKFNIIYEMGERDHTIRIDESKEEMFSLTLHLMLAAVTRYAVGLAYTPEESFDDMKELTALKEMLIDRYIIKE